MAHRFGISNWKEVMKNPKLAIIDDNPEISRFIKTVGERLGYTVEITTGIRAEKLDESLSDFSNAEIIIIDLVMPDVDGIEILRALARSNCVAKIILISGYDSNYLKIAQQLGDAGGLNISALLKKPFKIKALESVLSEG